MVAPSNKAGATFETSETLIATYVGSPISDLPTMTSVPGSPHRTSSTLREIECAMAFAPGRVPTHQDSGAAMRGDAARSTRGRPVIGASDTISALGGSLASR